jgi:hypothetical protein
MKAAPSGLAFANQPRAALPQPTFTVIKFAPRPLSNEFVECLRVMAESVITGSRLHELLNDQPPEMIQASFATFYLSPYFVKILPTFDGRIRGDSECFSLLNDIQALFSRGTLPDQRFTPHLTAQISTRKISPRAQRALHELALVQRESKEVLVRQLLAPEGLLLASGDRYLPQHIRLGKQWVKGQHSKRIELRPDVLPFRWFVCWLIQRAHRHVEGILLDRAIGGLRSDLLETNRVDFGGFTTEIVDRHPEAGAFAPSPEALLAAQTLMAALESEAPPRGRELLSLLLDGASRQEAATQLGIERSTVDVLCFRLKRKFHAL